MNKIMESKDFFKTHCQNVRNQLSENKFIEFSNLKTSSERFNFVHNLENATNLNLNLKKENSGKFIEKALESKKKGNLAFQGQKWTEALIYYNQSYFATPTENVKDLAVILANRSAALSHIEAHELAIKDINRSLSLGYPREMQYKIIERKAKSLLALKEDNSALAAFKETIHALDEAKLPADKRGKLEKDAQVMIKILQKNAEMAEQIARQKAMNPEPEPVVKQAPLKNNLLSKSVRFEHNELEGRFAVADNDIKVAEVILEEKPHVSVVLETYAKAVCQNCFKRSIAPLCCPTCSDVVFCSDDCLKSSNFHKIECGFLPIFWRSGASITCHMALRMITQKSEEYFLNLKNQLNENLNFEETRNLPTSDYRRVFNLVSHENERSGEDFFQRTIMASFLTSILKAGDFFKSDENIPFIGTLMFRNLQVLQFNAHEVSELEIKSKNDVGKSNFIGGALYCNLSLFNHSCDPGIVRYYNGANVCARAIKNIKAGDMIAENYGPLFTEVKKDERRALLKEQYHFDCCCKACEDNWPVIKEMDPTVIRFRCDSGKSICKNVLIIPGSSNEFMIKCTECGESTNILKGLKAIQDTEMLFKTANRLLETGESNKAIIKYIEMLLIMDETLAPPFSDYHLCQQGIRRCMLELGNKIG